MSPDDIKAMLDYLSAVANAFTIFTSIIAIIVYFKNRKKIASAVNLLLNFSFQSTLSELKEKLERLNEYSAHDEPDLAEIRSIFLEIAGQIRGNARLVGPLKDILEKIEKAGKAKGLTEPLKRSLVSELRENLRNIQVGSFNESLRESHE